MLRSPATTTIDSATRHAGSSCASSTSPKARPPSSARCSSVAWLRHAPGGEFQAPALAALIATVADLHETGIGPASKQRTSSSARSTDPSCVASATATRCAIAGIADDRRALAALIDQLGTDDALLAQARAELEDPSVSLRAVVRRLDMQSSDGVASIILASGDESVTATIPSPPTAPATTTSRSAPAPAPGAPTHNDRLVRGQHPVPTIAEVVTTVEGAAVRQSSFRRSSVVYARRGPCRRPVESDVESDVVPGVVGLGRHGLGRNHHRPPVCDRRLRLRGGRRRARRCGRHLPARSTPTHRAAGGDAWPSTHTHGGRIRCGLGGCAGDRRRVEHHHHRHLTLD